MKTVLLLLCLAASHFLHAQNTIFAGKITDAKGKPRKGTVIQVRGEGRDANAKSNDSGLFHTDILPAGDFDISAVVNGKTLKAENKIHLAATEKTKTYYEVVVRPNGLDITPTQRDLFKETGLAKVRDQQKDVDLPVNAGTMRLKHDDKHPTPKEKKPLK